MGDILERIVALQKAVEALAFDCRHDEQVDLLVQVHVENAATTLAQAATLHRVRT